MHGVRTLDASPSVRIEIYAGYVLHAPDGLVAFARLKNLEV